MTFAERLKSAFAPFFTDPLEAWQAFADACEVVRVKKEAVLKANHTVERYLYFILQGSGGVLLWNTYHSICT